MIEIQSKNITNTKHGETHFGLIEFADIFDDSTDEENKIDTTRFFAMRDSYFELTRGALQRDVITKEDVIEACKRVPRIKDADIKAYAAATAKYYLHIFGIPDEKIPDWIETTPACDMIVPFVANASVLKSVSTQYIPEFFEKKYTSTPTRFSYYIVFDYIIHIIGAAVCK